MENNQKEKKYETRRFFIYCHLVIGIVALFVELINNFRGLKLVLYSKEFEKNFIVKKYYYVKDITYRSSTSSCVYGFLEADTRYNKNNTRVFLMDQSSIGGNLKKNEKGEEYLEVWYCPKLDYVVSFANEIRTKPIFYDEFLSYALIIIWIIPEIWYLIILRKREKRALLKNKLI